CARLRIQLYDASDDPLKLPALARRIRREEPDLLPELDFQLELFRQRAPDAEGPTKREWKRIEGALKHQDAIDPRDLCRQGSRPPRHRPGSRTIPRSRERPALRLLSPRRLRSPCARPSSRPPRRTRLLPPPPLPQNRPPESRHCRRPVRFPPPSRPPSPRVSE